MPDWLFLDHAGPIPFAHRGGAIDAPENSFEAFESATQLGYRYLETDVHLTADGVVVAFHDSVLDRVTNKRGAVSELTWAEVSTARIDGVGTIPRFDELLASFPDARFNIDPKSDGVLEELLTILQRVAVGRICIGSFSDTRISRARERLGPALCTSMGPRAVARLRAASLGAPMATTKAGCVQVPVAFRGVPVVTERFVEESHRRGLMVHVWTVDEKSEMNRMLELGVDGIMTDRPEVLRGLLEERGEWA